MASDLHFRAEDVRPAAISAPPQPMGDHGHAGSGSFLVRRELATQRGTHSEQPQEVRRHKSVNRISFLTSWIKIPSILAPEIISTERARPRHARAAAGLTFISERLPRSI